jgi:hypothetical protein
MPATLNLCVAGSAQSYSVATDANGIFTVTTGLRDGNYNWSLKGTRHLANAGSLTIAGGTASVEMGLQRAGDCNNDNVITVVDFNILKGTFGKGSGDPGFDDRADLNRDGTVNIGDFNLQKGNFGQSGSTLACP